MNPSSRPASAPALQELRASRGATPPFHRRFRRRLVAAGVLIFLILFGFLGLPPIVKSQATKQLSARLGREVEIEKLRINPLVLSVTVEGFAIAESKTDAGEFTGWNRLYVNLDSWPLLLGRVKFSEIELDGFRARVAREEGGGFNFDDIIARLAATDAEAAANPAPSKPLPLMITRLAVTDARLSFTDASLERSYAAEAGPLTFTLQDFHTVGDPDSPYHFEAVTGAGEQLAWRGTVSADPIKSQGELRLANIDIARLSPYYHTLVSGELRSALVDVSGRYTFELKPDGLALTLADGALTVREVRFGAAGADADAFTMQRLSVTEVSADTTAMTSAIGRVSIEGVDLKVVRDADGVDLLRLLAPPAGEEAAAVAVDPSAVAAPADSAAGLAALPKVTLGELAISGVRVEATDLTMPRRAEHRIENLVLSLRDLDSSDLAKALPLALEITLPKEGRVAVNGTVAAQPPGAELDIVLERVGFANASPYVEPLLNVRLVDGVVRTRGKATLRDGAASFAGDFGIADFRAVDGKLAEDFLRWTDFSVSGIMATTEPLALHVDEVRFVEPVAAVRVEADGSLSIADVAVAEESPAVAGGQAKRDAVPATKAAPMPPVTVGVFAFERAAFRFEDRSIKPTARGGISDFTGTVTGLTSEALGRADVDIRGRVDGVAPVAITGKLNPLGAPAFVDLVVDFRGIDLQPGAGPYLGKFVGRELTRGSLNVAIKAKLSDRKLDADNVVTLDQFFLGARTNSPDATSLPVGLALALLRDTQGKIVVDLPVKGSLDDPNFKIGRVVVRVLVNILTKAATSPFSLLGAAFGGGGDELGWQDFAAGAISPDEAGIKKLETVAKALNGRPSLNLDIVGAYDPVADGAALRLARLEQVVRANIWNERRLMDPATPPPEQLEISPEQRVVALARLYAAAFPPAVGEVAPTVVAGADAGGIALPVSGNATAAGSAEAMKVPRRQIGRLPRFGARTAEVADAGAPAVSITPQVTTEQAPSAAVSETGEAVPPTITVEQMMLRLAAGMKVEEADLQALAEARAQGIRAWLLEQGKVPAERVSMGPLTPGGRRVNLNLR